MLHNINKTNQKLFTLVATSLLSIIVLPAPTSIATLSDFCSTKASTSGLHNNAEVNLHNQSLNDSNQVNIGSQQSISDPCQTSYVLDDPIYIDYIDIPTEGIDDEIYIDLPITNPNKAIYCKCT